MLRQASAWLYRATRGSSVHYTDATWRALSGPRLRHLFECFPDIAGISLQTSAADFLPDHRNAAVAHAWTTFSWVAHQLEVLEVAGAHCDRPESTLRFLGRVHELRVLRLPDVGFGIGSADFLGDIIRSNPSLREVVFGLHGYDRSVNEFAQHHRGQRQYLRITPELVETLH